MAVDNVRDDCFTRSATVRAPSRQALEHRVTDVAPPSPRSKQEATMKTFVNVERCSGHGRCYATAPELFQPNDEGYGRAVTEEVRPESEQALRMVAAECPEGAIVVLE
jgi:ferredoxin